MLRSLNLLLYHFYLLYVFFFLCVGFDFCWSQSMRYLAPRSEKDWEKLLVSVAGGIFNRLGVSAVSYSADRRCEVGENSEHFVT